MKCRALDAELWKLERERLEQQPMLPLGDKRVTVHFRFKAPEPAEEGDLFVIYSRRTRLALYRGAFQPGLSVEIDQSLLDQKGFDMVEFRLLRKDRYCTWSNERAEPYWRPGARIAIELLAEPTTDDDDLMKRFNVTIR